jgi:hypothetical protein
VGFTARVGSIPTSGTNFMPVVTGVFAIELPRICWAALTSNTAMCDRCATRPRATEVSMPTIGDRRRCTTPRCFAEMEFRIVGRKWGIPMPRMTEAGEVFSRTSGYEAWVCEAHPGTHIQFDSELHTAIKRCDRCGGPMFYTMRMEFGGLPDAGRPLGKGFGQYQVGTGWQCFAHPEHREIESDG